MKEIFLNGKEFVVRSTRQISNEDFIVVCDDKKKKIGIVSYSPRHCVYQIMFKDGRVSTDFGELDNLIKGYPSYIFCVL